MSETPVILPALDDINQELKNALQSFQREVGKVRPLFERVAKQLQNYSKELGISAELDSSMLELNIACFHRKYKLSYQVHGGSKTSTGALYLHEYLSGDEVQRAIGKVDDGKFVGYLSQSNSSVPFNEHGLIAVLHYWLSQPLPNLRAPVDINYSILT